jgi:hypothetical protein
MDTKEQEVKKLADFMTLYCERVRKSASGCPGSDKHGCDACMAEGLFSSGYRNVNNLTEIEQLKEEIQAQKAGLFENEVFQQALQQAKEQERERIMELFKQVGITLDSEWQGLHTPFGIVKPERPEQEKWWQALKDGE